MRIFVTGGTGFVGRTLCRVLTAHGHQLKCLVHRGSPPLDAGIEAVSGDLFDPGSLAARIAGVDAVIHLVGIIRESPSRGVTFEKLHHQATASIVAACEQAGVRRYLHMSANGTRADSVSQYHRTKWLAEERVRQSSLDWTIFRPSLIYGPEDQFINLISGLIRRLPVIPVMGDGRYQLQPVPVEQVAAGFAAALSQEKCLGATYHCGGADCISYNQMLDLVAAALGRRRPRKLYQPLSLMQPLVRLLQHIPLFPMTSDQLQMLIEGNCCDIGPWAADCDIDPMPFADGLHYLTKKQPRP